MAKKKISTSYTSWTGTSKKDKVYIDYADYVNVSTGKGNDSIYNELGYYATINTGKGNDTIMSSSGNGSSINAGAGDDKISLRGGYSYTVTLEGGTGNDTIYGSGNKTLHKYKSGDGNDVISNWSANDTLSITGGTYTRSTVGNDVVLKVGSGSITLLNAKGKTINIDGTLAVGKTITNTKNKKKLSGTSYADTITNSGSRVTILGGKGNDSITNTGSRVSIIGGKGNDWIFNEIVGTAAAGSYNTISTGAGNDTLSNDGANALILTGTGNDSVLNYGANSTINLGDGNDKIINQSNEHDRGSNVSIVGGAGKDTIWNNGGEKITIAGGTGNDSIINSGTKTLYKYAKGDGNDTIWGFNSLDTIRITGAKYTRSTVGSDVVLKVSKGSITLKDAANTTINIKGTLQGGGSDTVTTPSGDDIYGTNGHDNLANAYPHKSGINIFGYAGNDTITNRGNNVYISGGDGNDSIQSSNSASNVTVHGGDGSDRITVNGSDALIYGENGDDVISKDGENATIYGDAGSDHIYSYGSKNSIYGGSDNDYVYSSGNTNGFVDGGTGNDTIQVWYGNNLTINGGKGNDQISLSSGAACVIQYASGDGKDTVIGFNDNDTLKISGGSYTRSTVGSDVVFSIGNGSITLKNTKDKTINIETTANSYNVADDWISADDNNFTTAANLSSIVDKGAANYSVAELDSDLTSLTKKNNLVAYISKK